MEFPITIICDIFDSIYGKLYVSHIFCNMIDIFDIFIRHLKDCNFIYAIKEIDYCIVNKTTVLYLGWSELTCVPEHYRRLVWLKNLYPFIIK